ncbi:MAG: DNA-processing protein DprA [Steroidobacter sp.]
MRDLLSDLSPALATRAISPQCELGAYEALWAREGASFKSIAEMFREHTGAVPSDFVPAADAEKHARLALSAIKDAGITHFGVRVHGAGEYPDRLRDAENPVELLYFQGNWDIASSRCVAVVGTRHPTSEGEKRAAKLTRLLVREGFTIASGLAQGIDTVVHKTTIEADGLTVAIAGTPITSAYPAQNAELQKHIADHHLLISQVPIVRYSRQTFRGNRLFFPERNITMSALTEATIIVEAGNTSGTLIQARHALQQGRKLFILDSCFRNPELTWPQKYVERGAIRISEFEEIAARLAS